MKITLEQFEPNQAWVMFTTATIGNVYILLDVCSLYIFGMVKITSSGVQLVEIENLFQKAWNTKNEWPETFFVPDSDPLRDLFKIKCLKEGISFKPVPRSDLSDIIEEIETSLASCM